MTDSPKPLPYDMGNIGDLLKHGVMAEFIRWRTCSINWKIGTSFNNKKFVFFDPFCGHPWENCVNLNVIKRLEQLRDEFQKNFAIVDAQPYFDKRIYYGSAHVALHEIQSCGLPPAVHISDKSSERVKMLIESDSSQNIKKIKWDSFYPSNGYSILDSINAKETNPHMVLIDPFEDMEKIRQRACDISTASKRTAVVLFILINDDAQWMEIRKELCKGHCIVLTCPRLENTGINGESNYTVKVILTSHLLVYTEAKELRNKLKDYAAALTKITEKDLDGQAITCD